MSIAMRPIPPKIRAQIDEDLFYKNCAFKYLGECDGRVTIDHTIIFAGRQIDDLFNLVPVCAKHHGVDFYQDAGTELPKEMRLWVALNRATDEELLKYSKAINYLHERTRLNDKYGTYDVIRQCPIKKEQ